MKKQIQILIALLALSFALYGQSDRVKTVEVPDSASMILFNSDGTGYDADDVQEAFEWLDFNAGDIFYISTTGDNSTGKKGYLNKPFTPQVQFDSFENRTIYWWYPGSYDIGPGQEYNYNFSNTGTPPPYWLYAPNSKINIVENAAQDYVFKVTATRQTDTVFYFDIGEINLYDIAFCRTSEAANVGKKQYVIGKARTFTNVNPDAGGDASFVVQNSMLEIDSVFGRQQFIYAEPRNGDKNIINIGSFFYDQRLTPSATPIVNFASSTLWKTMANNPFFELNVKRLKTINGAPFFLNTYFGTYSSGAKDLINVDYAYIQDTTARIDTIASTLITSIPNNTNGIVGLALNLTESVSNNYSFELNSDKYISDKLICVRTCQDSANINLNIKEGIFSQTRAVVIEALTSDNAKININSNFLCRKSNVLSVLSTDNTTDISISGRHETQQPRQPVIYAAQNIILENAQLVNDGVTPAIIAPTPITVYVRGDLYMNSDSIHPNVTFVKIDYGYTNPTNTLYQSTQTILDSLFTAIPKHSATLYQSTLRQYTFTQDTITIDTLSNALMTDSITQDTGYIRNMSSDTMRWQVSYNFFRDSDEDALTSFMDITADGGDIPEAIPGSRAYSEQAVTNGTQHAGPTFTVDVPPGAALRLCVYSISAAAGVDISDMTISVKEIYRE